MDQHPSDRTLDQRRRNRIIGVVGWLADARGFLASVGFVEFFEQFYDFVPHANDGAIPQNSTFTEEEYHFLGELRDVMDAACDATPSEMSEADFLLTRWPDRIQPVARATLSKLEERGRFSEDHEEL